MNITPEILFQLINAQTFYMANGFEIVGVPWIVSAKSDDTTRPAGKRPYVLSPDRHLVGSGEQGFIELLGTGKLKNDSYQTITPCFRDESEKNELTREYFLKLELWSSFYLGPVASDVEDLALMALKFHKSLGIPCFLVKTPEGIDLQDFNGVELGSYGIRKVGDKTFLYGTGLAQPRANIAAQTAASTKRK